MSDQTMRVIQVGTGSIANAWMGAMKNVPGVELVGVVDLSREAAEKFAEKHELPASMIYTSLSDAVAAAKPDTVFDTTVPAAHEPVTLEALSLGCHVLGEKPMSDTLEAGRRMVAAAKETGLLYAVTQTRRPNAGMFSVADFLRSKKLGTLEELHCDFYIGAHFGGFRDEMDYPLILDMAIHTFDTARQVGAVDPVSVYCHCWNPPHSWSKGDMSAAAIFEMADAQGRPVVFTYRGSWVNEGMQTSWNAHWRCVGAQGTLLWDGNDKTEAQRVKEGGDHGFSSELEEVIVPKQEMGRTGHEFLIHDFLEAFRSGGAKRPMCHCDDNIKSLAMVDAAVQSARAGAKVDVSWS